MARILLVTLCLTFICVPNIIAVIWGDVGEKFEANMLADLEEDGETELEKTVVETKVLEDHTRPYFIQGRAAVAPPVRPVATTPARPGVVAVPTITTITYKLGKRIPGDHLLTSHTQMQQWQVAQNVTLNLSYPKAGVGSVITYIEIVVDQSTNAGRAFLTTGGIGQRLMKATVEAQKTPHFRQSTQIYGY